MANFFKMALTCLYASTLFGTVVIAEEQAELSDSEIAEKPIGKPVLFLYDDYPGSVAIEKPIAFQATINSVEKQGCKVTRHGVTNDDPALNSRAITVMTDGERHTTDSLLDAGGWALDHCLTR